MSGWRKAMAYLGLVDEVDEADDPSRRTPAVAARPREATVRLRDDEPVPGADEVDSGRRSVTASAAHRGEPAARPATPPTTARPADDHTAVLDLADREEPGHDNVRPLRPVGRSKPAPRRSRPETASHVAVVAVDQFDAVEAVAVRLREREPVVLDLSSADKSTARRVLDFVSGAVFAVDASLQPLGNRAFLVVPRGIEVSSNERRRLTNLGYRVELDRVGGLG